MSQRLGGRAAKPPEANWPWEGGVTFGDAERGVVEAVVEPVLEEVGVPVVVLGGIVDVVRDPLPVGDGTRIAALHWGSLVRVKLPILTSLEEIDFPVPRPDKSSVEIIRDSLETFRDQLGVAFVHSVLRLAPILPPFKEVSFAICPREGGVNVWRKTRPKLGDGFWKSWSYCVFRQLPKQISFESVRGSVLSRKHGVEGGIEAEVQVGLLPSSSTSSRTGFRLLGRKSGWLFLLPSLPIESLDRSHIVLVQLHFALVAAIEGSHESAELAKDKMRTKEAKMIKTNLVGVGEAKTVAKLMSGRLKQVCSFQAVDRPGLCVVKVRIAAIYWKWRVSYTKGGLFTF